MTTLGTAALTPVAVAPLYRDRQKPAAEVVFHFFGGKSDGRKVREAMNRLVERGRLADVPLVRTALAFRQEPTLLLQFLILRLQEVKVNQKNPVRENEEFIVSCIAQGSSHMTFTWFKDGVFVNHSKSIRNMWTKLIPMGSEDQYNAMLGIESATPLDAGWYTCQVVDLEVQQCKSVYVEVLSQPQVKISPMSVTVERGEDVTVKCMSTSSYQRHEKYGYNWTKNKALFPMMRNKIIWEDLYPSGSILKIFKAQKSAIFDCQVQGSVASNSASVTVEVVNKSVVALSAVPCPATHAGRAATRRCVLTDTHRASWQRPDFSQCRRPALAHIHRKTPLSLLGHKTLRATHGYHGSPAIATFPGVRCENPPIPVLAIVYTEEFYVWMRSDILTVTAISLAISNQSARKYGDAAAAAVAARAHSQQPQAVALGNAGIFTSPVIFILLTLGYQNTTGAETLADTLALLKKLTRLLPGEGEQVLDLLHDVQSYLNQTNFLDDILASVNDFYEIISILLDNPFSIQNPEKIVQLQELVNQESIIWGSFLIPMKTYKLQLSSIELIVSPFKTTSLTGKTFQKHFTSTSTTVLNKMTIYIDALKRRAYLNGTYCIAVVIYRNLTRFLPARYSCKLGDGTEMEYEINSQVVTVQLGHGRSLLHPAPGTFQVDLEMEQVIKEYNPLRWKSTCAVTSVAQVEHSWNIEGCKTHNGANNVSSCRCYQPGSFAILMTSHNAVLTSAPTINQHLIPLVGCIVCLLQTMMTLVLLLPHWWYHQNCLVFLKLQCSLAVMAAMITFVYVFQGSVGKEFFPYVTTSLEAFMLIGNSSHISKLLIVYTEVVKIPKVKHLKQTVICIITGVPVLALLCSHLVHHSTDWNLNSWWLIIGSTTFNIFITSITIMLLLFAFLYFMVIRKLSNYSRERHSGTKSVKYRTGLLKRAGIIFLMMVIVEISSILYINLQTVTYHYVFSVSTSLLGFSVLVCYIISSECPLHTKLLHKLKLVKTADVDFSSDSLNSPLRFFMKQEADLESTAAPQHRVSEHQDGSCERSGEDDGLLVLEERQHRPVTTEGDPSTVETYMTDEDIDLEGYSSSPRRYTQCRFVSSPQQETAVSYINRTSSTTEANIHAEVDTTVHETEAIPDNNDISEDKEQEKPYSDHSAEHSENVMDRISHDLDYLLNRWPPDHRVSRFSISSTIQEEDEEDEDLQV
ncbi:uncharacterized protein LOC126298235 [Schistocerca gregaria]|uniref:uncharacterized protein LOC126298235 n=1 Tax=Schistocerca gregaria TaxID=7010 RepID=UPI00211E252D|nr:uncharacterized protein LOC126298235 [Schistocerca gregaria]